MADEFYVREPLLPGMCGEDVRYLQEGLRIAGFDDVETSGVFDGRTEAAWRELQVTNLLGSYDARKNGMAPSYIASVEANLRGRYPDEESLQRAVRAQSPWEFDSKQDYEMFLRSEPNPLGPGVVDGDRIWEGVNTSIEARINQGISQDYQPGDPIDPAIEGLAEARNEWYFRHLTGSDENWTTPIKATDVAPPGSDSCLMSDAGEVLAPPALANHPLYAALRAQLPAEVGDGHVAELTVRAMKDGIASPDQLEQAVATDQRAFAVGKIPGFMGKVDLTQPPMSETDLRTAVSELAIANSAPTLELETPARLRRV